jgi:hypothetical protein
MGVYWNNKTGESYQEWLGRQTPARAKRLLGEEALRVVAAYKRVADTWGVGVGGTSL